MNYSMVGKSIPRIDAVQKVTGDTKYTEDLEFPRMLYGKLLTSPYPHAKILRIDKSEAEKFPGVHAVLCGDDLPLIRWGAILQDQTVFARNKVRYIGDVVAAVAAETSKGAEEALELIKVDYEELPAIFDPLEAIKDDAMKIHEEIDEYKCIFPREGVRGNINCYLSFAKGDVEKGFAESDLVFEEAFKTSVQYQAFLESHLSIAMVDGSGKLTVYTSAQMPHRVSMHLGEVFKMPMSKIRVVCPEIGGAFGGKVEMTTEPYSVALALATKRPVKIVLSRAEDMQIGYPRHASIITLKVGFKKDGTLHAFKANIVLDGGAFAFEGPMVVGNCATRIASPYRCPNIRIEGSRVYTNKLPCGAMRGFGNPQGTWAREQMMDIAAEKLGISPTDIRTKNFLKPGDTLVTGQVIKEIDVADCFYKVRKALKLDEPVKGKNRGRGVAAMEHISGLYGSSAFIKINEDGSVNLICGSTSVGGGQGTVLAQIAAETLGIGVDQIIVTLSDTETTPYDFGNAASRGTYFAGNAVLRAAEDARRQLFETVAREFGVSANDLEAKNGKIMVKGKPDKSVTIADVSYAHHNYQGGPILGKGTFILSSPMKRDPDKTFGRLPPVPGIGPPLTYAAQGVELEVDTETGVVTLLKLAAAHGVGKAINPKTVEGQIEGGVAMGIGYGLHEVIEFDGGKVVNPSLVDYRLPTIMDIPEIDVIIVEEPLPSGPYGAKGIGEVCQVATAPAIANAIYDAIGVRIKEQPITPERILKALEEKESIIDRVNGYSVLAE